MESCWNALFILIAVVLLLNIFLSWAFVTSLLGDVQAPMMIWVLFSPFFLDSLLVTVSGFIGLFRSACFFNLLCKFRGLLGSIRVSFPVMRRWKCLGMKISFYSQVAQLPGTGCRSESGREAVTQNPGRVCSILKQKREISLNIVITFGNKTFFITQCGN